MQFPVASPRLLIEPLAERDIAAFVAYRRDARIARWQSWQTHYDASAALELVTRQAGWRMPPVGEWMQLAIHDRTTSALLGDVAVHTLAEQPNTYEIGFTLAPAAQKVGIASEAVAAILNRLFEELHAHRVVAYCDERNTDSARLLTRLSFRHESHQIDADFFKGEWTTLDGYALLASEYHGVAPSADSAAAAATDDPVETSAGPAAESIRPDGRHPLPPLDTVTAARLWRDYVGAHPNISPSGPDYVVHAFGDSAELADELIQLVISGQKRATAQLLSEYAATGDPLPRIGSHLISCDGRGVPRIVLRTVEVRLARFADVDAQFAYDEGEGDRSLAGWIEGHTRYFTRVRAQRGETFSENDEVTLERLKAVWPPELAD